MRMRRLIPVVALVLLAFPAAAPAAKKPGKGFYDMAWENHTIVAQVFDQLGKRTIRAAINCGTSQDGQQFLSRTIVGTYNAKGVAKLPGGKAVGTSLRIPDRCEAGSGRRRFGLTSVRFRRVHLGDWAPRQLPPEGSASAEVLGGDFKGQRLAILHASVKCDRGIKHGETVRVGLRAFGQAKGRFQNAAGDFASASLEFGPKLATGIMGAGACPAFDQTGTGATNFSVTFDPR
jgi:hypothetical protein